MRYLIITLLTLSIVSLNAQTVDSFAIKQVDSLIKVSRDLTNNLDLDKALEVTNIAENIVIEKLGKETASFGNCIFNRARVLYYKGDYLEAEKHYLESISIRQKVQGEEHPDLAWSYNNLGILYQNMGNFLKAEPFLVKALAIREKVLGVEHPQYAESLEALAICYSETGDYKKAESYYEEVLTIRKKVLGVEHPLYTSSLINIAYLYMDISDYEKAEPLMMKAKAISEKVVGIEHPDYAKSLGTLANLYWALGKYERAEPLYIEANVIFEKVYGKEHPDYASTLSNLGNLYYDMGNFEKAELLYLEAKAIREKVQETEHPYYAGILVQLAILYDGMAKYEKAEANFLEAKEILVKVLGLENLMYTKILTNLAIFYSQLGKYEKAEPLIVESKDILGKMVGMEHAEYALCLHILAGLYWEMGKYDKVEPFLLDAKAIWQKVLGNEHPKYVLNLIHLANFYENQSRFDQTEPLLEQAYALSHKKLIIATSFFSENELSKYTVSFKYDSERGSNHLLLRNAGNVQPGILPTLVYNNALFYKGFLLTAASRLNSPDMSSPESTEIKLKLKTYRRQLAAEYAKPILERNDIAELEEKANTAEKELTRTVSGYAEAIRQVKWKEVQAGLKQSEVAIEFVHFRVNFPKETDSTMYAALLIKSGDTQPKFIPLFEEKSLDSLLHSKSERKADYVNSLYTLADRGAVAIEAPKKSLYEILWKPLEKELTGIKTIYFSPSGLLHRINLDAIPISQTETLADKYNLIELNSTRQLVIPTQIKNSNNDAVLYGGIQYEQDSIFQNNETLMASRSRGEMSFGNVDTTLRGGSWTYLTGTEREVNAIEKIMFTSDIKTYLKKGYDATEESFKNIGANDNPSPRILHIATHGYFFSDPKSTTKKSSVNGEQESVFKISDHPMLRSGLIMAGGNAAWKGQQTLEGREDGILTAYEISQMNLSNTELVVLSACETGLGDIQGNEGVYGLQRAFKIAGAKYLIMSLWQVPDKQTSLLMTTFYKKYLEEKMSIPDAFHAAQKELREAGLDPYQWAGFVLVE